MIKHFFANLQIFCRQELVMLYIRLQLIARYLLFIMLNDHVASEGEVQKLSHLCCENVHQPMFYPGTFEGNFPPNIETSPKNFRPRLP